MRDKICQFFAICFMICISFPFLWIWPIPEVVPDRLEAGYNSRLRSSCVPSKLWRPREEDRASAL